MRKLLDWIADKLGYQRKRKFALKAIKWPIVTVSQELLDDVILWPKLWEEAVAETFDYQSGET